MVKIQRPNKTFGIWELPDYQEIRRDILSSIDSCADEQGIVRNIVVFGSYGRGAGFPGKSDLDISLVLEEEFEDMVGYVSTVRAEEVFQCSKNKIWDKVPLGEETKIDRLDIRGDLAARFEHELKLLMEADDPNHIYLLEEEEVVNVQEARERIVGE